MRCRRREPAWCQQYCSWKAAGAAGTQPPLVPGPSARRRSCCGRTCGQHERARPVAPGGAGARGALSSWKFLLASPERPLFGAQAPRSQHPVCTWGRDAEGLGPCEHTAGARQPQARCGGSRLPPAPLASAHGSPTAPATTRSLLSAQPGRALWWGQVLLQPCQEPPRCCWPRTGHGDAGHRVPAPRNGVQDGSSAPVSSPAASLRSPTSLCPPRSRSRARSRWDPADPYLLQGGTDGATRPG